MRATARHSPNPQESGHMINRSTTTLRLSSVRALKRRTKRSALTTRHTRHRDGRRHNPSLPSSLIPGSKSSTTRKKFTPRSPQRTSSHTSKRGAQTGMPSTSWRCITKFSAITSRSRKSPSISICSRKPRGKPDERGEQSPMKPYSSSRPPRC